MNVRDSIRAMNVDLKPDEETTGLAVVIDRTVGRGVSLSLGKTIRSLIEGTWE